MENRNSLITHIGKKIFLDKIILVKYSFITKVAPLRVVILTGIHL